MKLAGWISFLSLLATGGAIALGNLSEPVWGVQTRDGTVAFEAGLRLVNTYATFSGVRVRQAKYYFDLELPEDIGEPLQQVTIQQRSGGDRVKFKPERTEVYLGSHRDKGEKIQAIASVNEAEAIAIKFESAVSPGNKVTIALKPSRNPDFAGVYLFGVTAFPKGDKPRGMYLGSGRLHFYRSGDSHF